MAILEPQRYETEEILRIPVAGADRCYVISGFADFTTGDGNITGSPNPEGPEGSGGGDEKWETWNLYLVVGEEYHNVIDVSPTAGIAGHFFIASDETDNTGIELENCKWDTVGVEGKPGLERIRLKIKLRMCGGTQSFVTKISYHLVAMVKVFSTNG